MRKSERMDREDAHEQEVLNRLAAIQAAAEILHDHDDMPHHERRLFLDTIAGEAARLSRLIRGCDGIMVAVTP